MSNKYSYDHRRPKHRKRHLLFVAVISLFVIAILAIAILYLINKTTVKLKDASGPNQIVGTSQDSSTLQTSQVNEPDYVFNLPVGWRQTGSVNSPTQHSISWQAFLPNQTARYLTIYEDSAVSTIAINRLLPVNPHGANLSYGGLSDNCSTFTDTAGKTSLVPVLGKWQGVTFMCDVPNYVDNKVGTGSVGSPINSVTLTGPLVRSHNFFFLYTDRNSTPDYTIFFTVLNSFTLK